MDGDYGGGETVSLTLASSFTEFAECFLKQQESRYRDRPNFISPSCPDLPFRHEIKPPVEISNSTEDNYPSCLSNRTTVLRSSSDPDSSSSVLPTSSDSSLTQKSVVCRPNLKYQISFEEWLRRKELELRHRQEQERAEEQKRREIEEQEAKRQREKKLQDEQNFQAWLRRKKKLDIVENEIFKNDINIQKQLVKADEKAKEAGKICVWKWRNKKAEQRKAEEREKQMRQKQLEEQKLKRCEESSIAYKKWQDKSKNIPKPATQGLLPHQMAKPAYTNPNSWQKIIDCPSDDEFQMN